MCVRQQAEAAQQQTTGAVTLQCGAWQHQRQCGRSEQQRSAAQPPVCGQTVCMAAGNWPMRLNCRALSDEQRLRWPNQISRCLSMLPCQHLQADSQMSHSCRSVHRSRILETRSRTVETPLFQSISLSTCRIFGSAQPELQWSHGSSSHSPRCYVPIRDCLNGSTDNRDMMDA
jgi:hypothetical protein